MKCPFTLPADFQSEFIEFNQNIEEPEKIFEEMQLSDPKPLVVLREWTLKEITSLRSLHIRSIEINGDMPNWEDLYQLEDLEELIITDAYKLNQTSIEAFKKHPNIKILTLNDCEHLSDATFSAFKTWENLEGLAIISGCFDRELTQASFAYLKNLKYLLVANSFSVSDVGAKYLKMFAQLEFLQLDQTEKMSDQGFKEICSINTLKDLRLKECSFLTGVGFHSIAKLESIERLELKKAKALGDSGLKKISQLYMCKWLHISEAHNITNEGIESLQSMKCLEILFLRDFCKKMLKITKLPKNLTTLGLPSNKSLNFNDLEVNENINEVILSDCEERSIDSQLTYIKSFPNLEILNLKGALYLEGTGFNHKMPSLTHLELEGCSKLRTLGQSGIYPNLRLLNVNGCTNLKDEALKAVSESPLNWVSLKGCLQIINLEFLSQFIPIETMVLDECLALSRAALRNIGRLSCLKTLSLSGCDQLTDDDLTELNRLENLRTLNLCSRQITERGIFNLIHLKNLRCLEIKFNIDKFSQDALRKFFKQFPNLDEIICGSYHLKSDRFDLKPMESNSKFYRLLSNG